jgi:hypothetical protein
MGETSPNLVTLVPMIMTTAPNGSERSNGWLASKAKGCSGRLKWFTGWFEVNHHEYQELC